MNSLDKQGGVLKVGCPNCDYRMGHAFFTNSHDDGCCPYCNTKLEMVKDFSSTGSNEMRYAGTHIKINGVKHYVSYGLKRFE